MSKYAAVVGAVNMDIWGRSLAPLIERDSNPGKIAYSPGGVGRNIAHNLALLGAGVEMLTALGDDFWAAAIEKSCRDCGIGLDRALRVPGEATGTYMFITGPDGDMSLAVSDMDMAQHISPQVIEANLDMLNRAELVVFDGNLREDSIDCLTAKCNVPIFADPVSVTKAKKLIPYLGRIHTIKPNALEACALTGESDASAAAEALVLAGVKRAFVSDGLRGMAAAHGLDLYHVDCCRSALVNATGAGDAVMAALCKSFLEGRDIVSSARYAMAAGAVACECRETINPRMSDALVKSRME